MKNYTRLIATVAMMWVGLCAYGQYSPDGSGYYAGLDLGYANLNLTQNSFFSEPNSVANTAGGFAGRAHIGYAFSSYMGLEAGFTLFPNAQASNLQPGNATAVISRYAVDLLLRPGLVFKNRFFIYGKIGMAYASTNLTYTAEPTSSVAEFRPVYGAQMAYGITPATSLNVAWLHFVGNTNSLSGYAQTQAGNYNLVPDADLMTLGVEYLF